MTDLNQAILKVKSVILSVSDKTLKIKDIQSLALKALFTWQDAGKVLVKLDRIDQPLNSKIHNALVDTKESSRRVTMLKNLNLALELMEGITPDEDPELEIPNDGVDRADLIIKIIALEIEIENSPYTIEESEQAKKEFNSYDILEVFKGVDKDSEEADKIREKFSTLAEVSKLSSDTETLGWYMKTMKSRLMKVETRYIATSERLFSPSGFHPDDRVFLQTTVAIHSDIPITKNNTNFPKLYVADMQDL